MRFTPDFPRKLGKSGVHYQEVPKLCTGMYVQNCRKAREFATTAVYNDCVMCANSRTLLKRASTHAPERRETQAVMIFDEGRPYAWLSSSLFRTCSHGRRKLSAALLPAENLQQCFCTSCVDQRPSAPKKHGSST